MRGAAGTRERHVHEGRSGLIDEGRHDAIDRLARRFRDGGPKVLGRRVSVRVRLQIRVDAFLECLCADVGLDHPEHGRAFLIRDRVERFFDLRRSFDLVVDGPRRSQRVEVERGLALEGFIDRHVPLGLPCGERMVRHPRREPFVQPDIVPPLHRHEVAKPLMGHFVGEDRRNLFSYRHRGRLRVGEQIGLAIKDRRRVFHGARREIGNGDDVELAEGILDGEVAVVEPQDLLHRLEREVPELLFVRRRADADRHALRAPLETLEPADRHRHEVARHLRRRREFHGVLRALRTVGVGHDRAVRDRRVAAVDDERDGKRRLECGLVEARERTARVGRLKLRHGVAALFAPA